MNGNIRLIGILAMVLLVATVQMAGAESQDWRLLGEDHDYEGKEAVDGSMPHCIDCNMSKTENTTKSRKDLSNDETAWWYAESPAQFDGLTFGEGDWTVEIDHAQYAGYTIFANVCKVNDTTGEVTYLANGSESANSSGTTTITCTDVGDTDQVFNTTDRLALRIYHDRSDDLRIYYYKPTSHHSRLTSPSSDPGYPVPELPTIILTATGILVLAGYASLRRSRKTDK